MIKTTFYIGQGKDKDGQEIPDLAVKQLQALELIAKEYDGYTAGMSVGGWINPKGELIQEPALRVEVIYPEDRFPRPRNSWDVAKDLGRLFGQAAVFVTTEYPEAHMVYVEE